MVLILDILGNSKLHHTTANTWTTTTYARSVFTVELPLTEELVDVLLEIPDEVERPPAPSSVGGVVVTVAVGGASLFLCQQVLLLQSLEVGKPLSVLSLAPLPAIRQDNLYYWKDRSLGLVKFSMT